MNTNLIFPKYPVFTSHKDFSSNYFRIPFLDITPRGTLIAGGDVRYQGSSDYNQIDIAIARSIDSGCTWINKQIVHKRSGLHPHSRKMNGCILVDQITGRIFLFAISLDIYHHLEAPNNKNQNFIYRYSDDDGITWSDEISLKHLYTPETILLFQSPGKGIQLEDGTLIIPIQQWKNHHTPIPVRAGFIYSTNHGASWQMSYTLVPTRSSESAILEYLPNQLLMSCRDDKSTGRRFYTTNDLGKTWIPHDSDSTILESNGCQSSMIKIKAPNGRYYGLYTAPQHQGHTDKKAKLTLMMTTNFIKWNTLTEVIYGENDGHSCLAYDETNQKLFLLAEESGSLIFYDLTHFLPLIMQNTLTYHNQSTSLCHPNPVYSQGHYINTDKRSTWYELLTVKLKQSSYLLLKLNLLSFESECDITLKIKQESAILHDTNYCQLYLQNTSGNLESTDLILIPQEYEEGYFIYKLYYLSSSTNSFLSLSVINCLYSEDYRVILNINTNQRCLHSKNALDVLPSPYSDVNYIHPIIK